MFPKVSLLNTPIKHSPLKAGIVVWLLLFSQWTLAVAPDVHAEAEDALMAGDPEGALMAYVMHLETDPGDEASLEAATMLAADLGLPEMGIELLRMSLEHAVATGDQSAIAARIASLSGAFEVLPAWVQQQQAAISEVDPAQSDDYEFWQQLTAESQIMMNEGDFETAAAMLEEAVSVGQSVFGDQHWTTISALRDLGFAARQLGDAETADAYYTAAYELSAGLLGDAHPSTQAILELMVELYAAAGAMEDAAGMQEIVAVLYSDALGPAHKLTLDAQVNQASIAQQLGDNGTAAELLSGVCNTFEQTFSVYFPETVSCLSYLAGINREGGELDEAERVYRRVIESVAATSTSISVEGLNPLLQLADIQRERGKYAEGKALLSGVIPLANQIGAADLSYTGKAYLSRILEDEGQLENAEKLAADVVDYGRTAWADNPLQFYNAMLSLGVVYQRQSRFGDAESVFNESVGGLLSYVGEAHPSTLVAMNNLGNLYEQIGLYDEAEPLLKQTLEAMEVNLGPTHPQTSRIRNNLALLHESQGNFREAEPLYLTSYELTAERFGDNHPEAIGIQNNLAFLYMMMEDYESAATMFEDIVLRWQQTLGPEHQDALKGLNNLGRAYRFNGDLASAEQRVATALQLRRQTLGEEHIDTIRSLIDLGAIYLDQERLEEAEGQLRKALNVAEKVIGEQHPYTFEALNYLADVLEAQDNLSAAIDLRETGLARRSVFLDRMLWVTGENAREGYIRLHRPELNAYFSLLVRSDDPQRGKKAIEASLQRKGLLLKITSEIEQIAQLSQDPALADISTRLEEARQALASLTLSGPTPETQGRHAEALYELELQVNELQGELGRASARYRSSIAGMTADELSASVPEGRALVDYLNYEEDGEGKLLAGVLINEDGEIRYDLVAFSDLEAIQNAVIEFRTIIQDDLADEDEVLEYAQDAYNLIWAPVVDVIGDLEYVYLIPDGVLNILPFNAMMTEDEEYLIEVADLHILTSGRDLLPNEYQLAEGEYVILAGPDYNADDVLGEDALAEAEGRRSTALRLGIRGAGSGLRGLNFAPLPGAEEEGRIITQKVNALEKDNEVFFGAAAEEKVLAAIEESPEILHVATHGFFLEADDTLRKRLLKMQRGAEVQVPPPGDNPLLRAGLAFAGINANAQFLGDIDTVNDGVLTALEVLGLNLSGTRLVVLSACETGLGEIHEGEGVYGLRRSFQEAGVAEVISSLWEVSDAGTQALMTDFYARVLEGVPAREAMRDSQLALMDSPEWGYPYVWSAFMIVGSYESAGISIQ